MSEIRWDLAANAANSALRGFEQGMAMGEAARQAQDRRELRGALAAYANNPEDRNALATIFQHDPQVGAKLMDRANERAFGRDMGEYLAPGPQTNVLLGIGSRVAAPARTNALTAAVAPVAPGATFEQAFQPIAEGNREQPANDETQTYLAALGEPQDGRDQAFLRMVRRDPIKALRIQSTLRDNFIGRVKAEREFYGLAVEELSTMTDEAGWQRALQRLAPMASALGTDLLAVVPPTYPGPEGVNQLLERAMPVKQQLDHFVQVANIEADNERADRNTDSLIETRTAGQAERTRHNRAIEGNTRRGQDIGSKDRRRGQDISASRGSPRVKVVSVSTPAEAMKLKPGTRYKGPDGVVRER